MKAIWPISELDDKSAINFLRDEQKVRETLVDHDLDPFMTAFVLRQLDTFSRIASSTKSVSQAETAWKRYLSYFLSALSDETAESKVEVYEVSDHPSRQDADIRSVIGLGLGEFSSSDDILRAMAAEAYRRGLDHISAGASASLLANWRDGVFRKYAKGKLGEAKRHDFEVSFRVSAGAEREYVCRASFFEIAVKSV